MQAQLTIHISETGIQKITASGLFITLAHRARGPAGPAITWLAFAQPFVNNIVRWDPSAFAIYMTHTLPFPGETILVQHPFPAELGWEYTFDGKGFFGFPGGPADVCTIVNPESPNFFFGLAYRASVNGTSILAPINVAQLPNGSGQFAPGEELSVFLSGGSDSGTVRPVPDNALTVKPGANVVFDEKTSTFRNA